MAFYIIRLSGSWPIRRLIKSLAAVTHSMKQERSQQGWSSEKKPASSLPRWCQVAQVAQKSRV